MNKSEHSGRRGRVRSRFINEGLEHFEDHEVLELLLYYAIPCKDTNELAHKLVNEYGGFSEVVDQSHDELMNNMGLSYNTSVLLELIPELCRRYMTSRWGEKVILNSAQKAGEYMVSFFAGKKEEEMYMICMDNANKVLAVKRIASGTVNETHVYPRNIVELVIQCKASRVIISHNHPGGLLYPSQADKNTTVMVAKALETIQVQLCDHIIVSGEKYVSMAELGEIRL